MWATHAVHHSSTQFNLTAAVRLGWTGPFSGAVFFFVPLTLIGFHPLAVIGDVAVEPALSVLPCTPSPRPRLGPLEWVLNTPAHHRVHHASNLSCLDKNFGGVLHHLGSAVRHLCGSTQGREAALRSAGSPCPRRISSSSTFTNGAGCSRTPGRRTVSRRRCELAGSAVITTDMICLRKPRRRDIA